MKTPRSPASATLVPAPRRPRLPPSSVGSHGTFFVALTASLFLAACSKKEDPAAPLSPAATPVAASPTAAATTMPPVAAADDASPSPMAAPPPAAAPAGKGKAAAESTDKADSGGIKAADAKAPPAAQPGVAVGQGSDIGFGLRPCCQALLASAGTTPAPGNARLQEAATYCQGAMAQFTPGDDAIAQIRERLAGTPMPASCK